MVAWRLSFRSMWSLPTAWFCPTNSWPALLRGRVHVHTHRYAHVVDCDTSKKKKKEQQKKNLHAQHKASCWSNYRNMAEHDEAGPSIRKEIERAEEK